MSYNSYRFRCNEFANIDDRISGLVFILNYIGIKTVKSCQGHLDGCRHPYPWICIDGKDKCRLKKLIESFNKNSEVEWGVEMDLTTKQWLLKPKISAIGRNSLFQLQSSGMELAHFLIKKSM